MSVLNTRASLSQTSRLWIENLILHVFNMVLYIHAEHEFDWALHLETVKEMIPLFSAAGHINYAHYALYYLHLMESMNANICKPVMK